MNRRVLLAAVALTLGPALGVGIQSMSATTHAASVTSTRPDGGEAHAAKQQNRIAGLYTFPDLPLGAVQNSVLPGSIKNDRHILLGSMGSDLWHGREDDRNEFWMVTDFGPSGRVKVGTDNRRTFAVPEYDPMIVHVEQEDGALRVLDVIPITGQSGKGVTGMPNTPGRDEVVYDYTGTIPLGYNQSGLDIEGLVRTERGDFWLVEEWGPSIVHVDRHGKVLKRYVPAGLSLPQADYPVASTLPAIYAKRKVSRGFEGVTINANETTLFIVLQSPLYNPDKKTGDASRNTRILVWDIASEQAVAEYAYRFDVAATFGGPTTPVPADMKLSAVAYVNDHTLLIDERTDDATKIYQVDLRSATNILGSKWDAAATSPSLEALADPATAGVAVVPKTLVVDLAAFPLVPTKIEGLTVIDKHTIAVANDNSFDVGTFDANGNNIGDGVKTQIAVIRLAEPLDIQNRKEPSD